MRRSLFLAAVMWAASLSTPSLAQQFQCLDNPSRLPGRNAMPPPDYQSSLTWARLGQAADAEAMRAMVGTWYNENRNAQLQMTQYIYSSFDPNGLFQYRDKTCGALNTCSSNEGQGSFRAARQADQSILYMINVSDLNRINQCVSDQVTFPAAKTMMSRTGAVWRRTQ